VSFPALSHGARFLRSSPSLALAWGALCVLSTAGCSTDATGADDPGGVCNVQPTTVTELGQTHVSVCSDVSYADNPPAGGNHYPNWAAFESYSFPVPRGFWVHDLEHGAIVFSYSCDASSEGCAQEVAQVQALIDALPADPACSAGTPRRVVLTPDPLLDVRWGVSAWGFTLRADCVDQPRFEQFYLNHVGRGPEDLCNPGTDFAGVPPCE
jgi:uncharacterized protein DUF3105